MQPPYHPIVRNDLADINECIRLAPHQAKPRILRTAIYINRTEFDLALSDAEEAVRLEPENATAHVMKGWAYWGKEDYARAMTSHDRAIQLNPRLPLAYLQRGITHIAKKEYDLGIADLNRAVQLGLKDSPYLFCWRGSAYRDKKEYAKAAVSFRQAIQFDPKNVYSYGVLAELLACCPDEKVRDGKQAWEYAKRATELTNQEDPAALAALAAAFAECRDYKQAAHWQEKVLEFPEFMKKHGDDMRARLALYRAKKPYRLP